jgi:NAD(P)-dependent dehydrogenase (short-subunit alcohol dehydrogenase family)
MPIAASISKLFDLSGRTALITGGAAGIGLATARHLGLAGAAVVLNDLRETVLVEAVRSLTDDGIAARGLAGDVSDEATVARIAADAGPVDILVNNAGLGCHTHPERLTVEEWNRVIAVNLTSAFLMSRAIAGAWIASGRRGVIVNTSSIGGSSALGRGNMAYSVAKAGLNQMTRELAVEWAGAGIRVNAIQPCQVSTPGFAHLVETPGPEGKALLERMLRGIPVRRLAVAEDVAAAMHFLVSDASAMITGVMLPVDGGNLALNPGGTPR